MEGLTIYQRPELENPPLVLGFGGWMDGGRVSTGTIDYLREKLEATRCAEIDSLDFHIFNFPVSTIPVAVFSDQARTVVSSINPMEFSAIFRPHTRIENGIIEDLSYQKNEFFCAQSPDLVLFSGEEPHIRWRTYCDCIFGLAEDLGVKQFYFVGSVSSPIPHTREPRIRASMPSEDLRERLSGFDIEFTDYEGPASIVTLLTERSAHRGIEMISLVVEVPHYPFLDMPTYPKSVLKAVSTLAGLLHLNIDLSDLRESADQAENKLNEIMAGNREFRELVRKLEEVYDYEESSADEEILRRLIEGIDLGSSEDKN